MRAAGPLIVAPPISGLMPATDGTRRQHAREHRHLQDRPDADERVARAKDHQVGLSRVRPSARAPARPARCRAPPRAEIATSVRRCTKYSWKCTHSRVSASWTHVSTGASVIGRMRHALVDRKLLRELRGDAGRRPALRPAARFGAGAWRGRCHRGETRSHRPVARARPCTGTCRRFGPQPRFSSTTPESAYSTVSTSGEMRRPCRVTSSPVLTTTVSCASGAAACSPRAKREPPTPPASATTLSTAR